MNLFAPKKSPTEAPAQLTPRRNLLDAGEYFHLLNSQLAGYNNRLAALASMIGGPYPIAREDLPEAPADVIGRLFYDLDYTQVCLNALGAHIAQFEKLCGIPELITVEAPQEAPGFPEAPAFPSALPPASFPFDPDDEERNLHSRERAAKFT